MTVDVLCIGNAVVDILLTLQEHNPTYHLTEGELRIKAGEKILTKSSFFSIGGGACRVAIGVTRLGFQTTIYAQVGTDEFAARIFKTLQKEHVDTSRLVETAGQTAFTVGLNFSSDRTLFTSFVKRENTFDLSQTRASWVYVGSLCESFEDAYENAVAYSERTSARLVFNPGPTQFAKGVDSFAHVLEKTAILFVNKQEAQLITQTPIESGQTQEEDMRLLLTRLQDIGPETVVITDGKHGSYALSGNEALKLGSFPTTVIEKTGAGDAYVSGFLAAILLKKPLAEAMLWGTCSASSVISHPGAHEGLLTKEQMLTMTQSEKAPKASTLS